jgi:phospholipid/cholesterol/gamma-HCH transport system ATP-binding protein
VIRCDDVHKVFGSREVLRGVTLDVPDGSSTVLLGRSGSGKSVLLKHIVGLMRPDRGSIVVDDRRVETLEFAELNALRREIGYVFQFAALFDSLTCAGNLRLALQRQGLDDKTIAERTRDALALVGLPEVADRYPAELSGGMRKRIGIARAVVLRPRYILWDEPTTGLDPVTTATMDRLMQQVRATLGVTSVVVTHDLTSAFAVGDRIALLHEGTIRAAGTPDEIRASDDPVVRQFIEGRPE